MSGHAMQWFYDDIFERGMYVGRELLLREHGKTGDWLIPATDHGKEVYIKVDQEDWLDLVRYNYMFTQTGYAWRNNYEGSEHDNVYLHVEVMARKLGKDYRDVGKRHRRNDDVIFKNGDRLDCRRDN